MARLSSIKDRINRNNKAIDSEFFSLPFFGNGVTLTINGSTCIFKGNFGNGLVNTLDKNFIPRKKIDVLFDRINSSEIVIDSFFMPELHTIINELVTSNKVYPKTNKKTLANLLIKINTETWYRSDELIDYRYALDMDRVNSVIALKLKEYQENMFKRYEYLKNKLGYRGMLLDVAAGGGKTLMALAMAEAVRADKVIIITLKANLQTTWVDALLDDSDKSKYYFKNKIDREDVYTVDDYNNNKVYNKAKYIIFNYESLDKLTSLLGAIKATNPCIVIDEAHNFISLKSNRREELLKLVEKSRSDHVFPLTGTAIKDSPLDMLIYMELIDTRISPKVLRTYRGLYSSPNSLLKSIVPMRYGELSLKVEKHELKLDPIEYITLDVTIPNPERFSLANIKKDMIAYFDARTEEIYKDRDNTRKNFDYIVNKIRKSSNLSSSAWDNYLYNHSEVRKLYDSNSLYLKPDLAKEVSIFERDNIISKLPSNEKDVFKDLTTLLKYPILKVRGEVLGRVVLKARIDCHKEMAERVDYSILNTTLGKSVFMSNYIPVCEAARNSLVSQGFKPIEIYGEFTKDQDNRIRLFKTDPSIDPLVGTLKSISTAHHFAIADMILLGDTPFRTYMLDQAIARAWRTGQQNQVKIVYTRLKYNEDNINSRNIDILKWAKSMVEEITGTNISYLDFDKGRSVENIDLEDIDDLIVNEDINENNEENDMSRAKLNERLNKSAVIDNETGDVNTPVDSEGLLSNIVDKIKSWFKKKEENKKKDVVVDCESELAYTTIEQLTGNIYGPWQVMYDIIIDDCENDADIGGLVSDMEDRVKEIDKAIADGSKKVPNRKLKASEYDSELFDPKWGFKEERSYLKYAYECNESTIKYINGDIWINDNEKELVDKEKITKLLKLNKECYDKILKAINILEKGIKVNKIDSEDMDIMLRVISKRAEKNIDAEGIVSMMTKTFTWLKDITTTDKQRLKGYALKINPAAYNIYTNTIDIGGEFLEKGIAYLDDEDSSIPVHIDEVDDAAESIRKIMKVTSKPVILEPNTIVYGEDPFHSDTYNASDRDFIKLMATKFEIRQNAIINMCMVLYKGKKLSEGFSWYIDMAELGIKTYKDDKEIVKSLTSFRNTIKEAMNYIDNNIKLVKIDNKKLDAETFNAIDHESIDRDALYIETSKTVDSEGIILPIVIAAGAYSAYKLLESYVQDNYGMKKGNDLESFDVSNNNSDKSVVMLNNLSVASAELSKLVTSQKDHILTITSDNIKSADLESFDVIKGLASNGMAKASRAFSILRSVLKTNNHDYSDISKTSGNLDKEIGIPRGYVGMLVDSSNDVMEASKHIELLKEYTNESIKELSTLINSVSARESSIANISLISKIDASSKELYNINTKYLTTGRNDRAKIYDLLNNTSDLKTITSNMRKASILIDNKQLESIRSSLSMIDELVKALVSNKDTFSKQKIKDIGNLIDHLTSYVNGVATLVYLKNNIDIMIDDIKKVI